MISARISRLHPGSSSAYCGLRGIFLGRLRYSSQVAPSTPSPLINHASKVNNGPVETNAKVEGDWTKPLAPPPSRSASGLDLSEVGLVQKMLFSHRPAQASQASQIAQTTPSSSQSLEQEDESTESSSPSLLHRLDLRVGRIVSVKRHEGADTLYIQEVLAGDDDPILSSPSSSSQDTKEAQDHPPAPKATRTIVSGLVPYVSASELSDSSVVLVRNLKPAKLRGVFSQGMLLCAEREGQVTPLRPPVGSLPGDRIWAQGHDLGDPDPVIRPKLKIVEQVCRDLRTNEDSVPTYRGEVLRTSSGPLYTSLPNASIR